MVVRGEKTSFSLKCSEILVSLKYGTRKCFFSQFLRDFYRYFDIQFAERPFRWFTMEPIEFLMHFSNIDVKKKNYLYLLPRKVLANDYKSGLFETIDRARTGFMHKFLPSCNIYLG